MFWSRWCGLILCAFTFPHPATADGVDDVFSYFEGK